MTYLPPDINFLNIQITSVFFVAAVTGAIVGLIYGVFWIWFEYFFKH